MTNGMERSEYFAEATKGLDVTVDYIARGSAEHADPGTALPRVVRTLTDADVDSLGYFRFIPEHVRVGGVPVWLSRTGFSGELGFELFLRPEHAQACGLPSKAPARPRTASTYRAAPRRDRAWS